MCRRTTEALRRSPAAILLMLALSGGLPDSAAAKCSVGGGLGSTLLFPYFEVDLANPGGLTSLIAINNESGLATLARVVVWTDWAVPVLSFDVYLKARDVQTMNLRDVLNGIIPSTGSGDDLSGFANCGAKPPFHANPALDAGSSALLRNGVTGIGFLGNCVGEPHGDQHARGYITVDAVKACNGISTSAAGPTPALGATYFANTATVKNSLWGDLLLVDPAENSAQGIEAVHIEGDAALQASDSNTFYGHFVGWTGVDRRSPLPSLWATRYLNGGVFSGGTDLLVFRSRTTATLSRPCGSHPSWYPLVASTVSGRDEDTNPTLGLTNTTEFPLATQRVAIGDVGPGPTSPFGRVQINFGFPDGKPAGAWLIPVMTASGRFSVGLNGAPVNDGCGLDPTP